MSACFGTHRPCFPATADFHRRVGSEIWTVPQLGALGEVDQFLGLGFALAISPLSQYRVVQLPSSAQLRQSVGSQVRCPLRQAHHSCCVCPASSQSETSLTSGSSTTWTLHPCSKRDSATCTACFRPGLSASGMIRTDRPLRISAYSLLHFPAPPGLVVANNPRLASPSASRSPSTT